MTFSLAAASKSLSKLMPATAPVTYVVLTICCLLYGFSLLRTIHLGGGLMAGGGGGGAFGILFSFGAINGRVLQSLGASLPLFFNLQQPWRFITAVFLPGSLMHIVFNMWVIMDVGPMVEELYGSGRYLFVYAATGAAGYFLSSLMGRFSVGASGALLGLIGVMLAVTTRRGGAAMEMLRGQLIRWLIYIGVMGLLMSGIDNWAHFGGLASGFLLGRVMADREPATPGERKRAQALGWVTALVVVASFAAMLFNYLRPVG